MKLLEIIKDILLAFGYSFQPLPVEELEVIEKNHPLPLSRLLEKEKGWSPTQLKIFATFLFGYTISYPSLTKRSLIREEEVFNEVEIGQSLEEDRSFLDALKRVFQEHCIPSDEKTSDDFTLEVIPEMVPSVVPKKVLNSCCFTRSCTKCSSRCSFFCSFCI